MKTRSSLLIVLTLIVLASLFLDVGNVEAKGRKHRKHKHLDNAALVQMSIPPVTFNPAYLNVCEAFVDKECSGNLRMHILGE